MSYSYSLINKRICVTGKCAKGTRKEMFDLIRRYGGIPSRYVSRQTDLLIVGDLSRNNNTSNKLERAKQLGIPIITEDEFYGLVDIDP